MPKSQEDLKLSDLAGAKPVYQDIHIDISGIMFKYADAVYELDRVLFGTDKSHVNGPSQTMNGWYDINLLPYYKYRLETTPIFHSDDVISEFIGNLEKYLIDLTDLVAIERSQNYEPVPEAEAAKDYSKLTMPDLMVQAQAASKAIKKTLGNISKKLENDNQPTDWTPAPEDTIHDAVSHPSYYDLPSGAESKDVIRAALGDEGYEIWCQGTALKYLFRYPNKENPVMDLNKAKQYIDFILDLRQEDVNHE